MHADFALRLFADLLWNAALICLPVVAITLVAGVLVSIFQVVTQIQDSALSFIPKIGAALVALVWFGPWMLRTLVAYAARLLNDIPQLF